MVWLTLHLPVQIGTLLYLLPDLCAITLMSKPFLFLTLIHVTFMKIDESMKWVLFLDCIPFKKNVGQKVEMLEESNLGISMRWPSDKKHKFRLEFTFVFLLWRKIKTLTYRDLLSSSPMSWSSNGSHSTHSEEWRFFFKIKFYNGAVFVASLVHGSFGNSKTSGTR